MCSMEKKKRTNIVRNQEKLKESPSQTVEFGKIYTVLTVIIIITITFNIKTLT